MTPGLHDFAARLLLRYFRASRPVTVQIPDVDFLEDADLLRYHWSVSRPVLELSEFLNHNRHEVQSSRAERFRIDDTVARGRIDARETVIERLVTGYPTRLVFAEPVRSFTSGPN